MHKVYGWWEYDPETSALVNAKTDQRFVNEGRVREDDGSIWHRLLYSDPDVEFPLYSRQERQTFNDPFQTAIVDYEKSAEVWQRALGGKDRFPDYWAWRRVEDCVLDVFLLWPKADGTKRKGNSFTVLGGWRNAAWSPDCRKFWRCAAPSNEYECVEPPTLVPLDAPLPHTWNFIDIPVAVEKATIDGLGCSDRGDLTFPPGEPLQGFEETMPHLMRCDGKAVFLPTGISHYFFRGEDFRTRIHLRYVDEDVVLGCTLDHSGAGWEADYVDLALSARFRHDDIAEDLRMLENNRPRDERWIATGQDPSFFHREFSIPMWRKLSMAFIDAFSCWRPNRDVKINVDAAKIYDHVESFPSAGMPSERMMVVDLRGLSAMALDGTYIGGILNRRHMTQSFSAISE